MHFSDERHFHKTFHFLDRIVPSEKKHQLCDGSFRSEVMSGDYSRLIKRAARLVPVGKYFAVAALGHVDYDQTTVAGLLDGIDKPSVGGSVAGSVSFQTTPRKSGACST